MNSKLKAYNRNRYVANLILIGSLLLMTGFIIIEKIGTHSTALDVLSYLTEAVLVASMADFIAILALSTPIFGLKFTGMIQNKRNEIIEGFVNACETRIIPQKKLTDIVKGYNIVDVMKKYFTDTSIKEKSPIIGKALANFIKNEEKTLSKVVSKNIISYIGAIDSRMIIVKIEKTARNAGWLHNVISTILDKLDEKISKQSFVDELEENIRIAAKKETPGVWGWFKRKAGEITNTLNYRDLATSITASLREVLREVKKSESSDARWAQMETFLSQLIQALANNPSFISALNQWKADAVKEEDLTPLISTLLKTVADWLEDGTLTSEEINRSLNFNLIDDNAKDVNVSEWLSRMLTNGLHALEKNDKLIRDEFAKLAKAFIEKEYKSILEIIQDVLSKLSDQGLVEKVNEVVGGNLQWLRISGAYIGLLTGVVLYAVVRFPIIGLPIFVLGVIGVVFIKPIRNRLIVISVE